MLICDISILHKAGKGALDEGLAPTGFDWKEMVVLMVLEQMDGSAPSFIRQFLQMDKGNVTKLLNAMEGNGYIRKAICDSDRRSKHIFLDEKGRAALPALHDAMAAWENRCYAGFSESEIAIHKQYNRKMMENLVTVSLERD